MDKIKIGCIGLGQRGECMLKTILNMCDNVEVIGVCDLYEDRAENGAKIVKEKTGKDIFKSTNASDIIGMKGLDAVLIFAAWEAHIPLAVEAMEKGVRVGVEVAGAYSLNDCFKLVETYERTKVPVMMIENCCYGRKELSVLKMVREGLFGEIVHCAGGYYHDLRDEIAGGVENRHYRLRNYLNRNCENYPTHELGPICKVLNINRGNRMLSLSSFASKSCGMKEYINANKEKYPHLVDKTFNQGDIINTIITCADGSTISLTLDTTLPRAYSRGFTVRGTKGSYFEDNDSCMLEKDKFEHFDWKKYWGNGEEYREKYKHPLWEKYEAKAKEAGHDGMDFMVLSAFFESVEKQVEPPIDVYDMASWMCITALSEDSISNGGQSVTIPDFTHGMWTMERKAPENFEFALDW